MGRMRWPILTTALLVGYNATLGILSYWQQQEALDDALRSATVAANVLADQVEGLLDGTEYMLSGLGDVLNIVPTAWTPDDPTTHRLLVRRQEASPWLNALFLVGPDGKVRNSSSSANASALDVRDRDYFQAHLQNQTNAFFFIGRPIRSRVRDAWLITVSSALRDASHRVSLVMVASISSAAIQRMITVQNLPEGFRVALMLRDGSLIGCQGLSPCLAEGDNTRGWSLPTDNAQSGLHVGYLPGVTGVGVFRRNPRHGITVVIQGDQTILLQSWRGKRNLLLSLALGGNVALLLGITALHQQIRRRRQAMAALEEANSTLESKIVERTKELVESENRMRAFIMAARDAVVIIDRQGAILEFNPSAEDLFGYRTAEVRGKSVNILMPSAYAIEHDEHLRRGTPTGQRAIGRGREMVGRRKNGEEFSIELTVGTHVMAGSRIHVGVIRDITERKANEELLRRLAKTDGLTGVLNRRAFYEEGAQLCFLAGRHNRDLAVLMIDADHFKAVNDVHGHDVGDTVLKALVEGIASVLRHTDILGRLGGEEFGVVMPETDPSGADEVARKILEAIRALSVPLADGTALKFTVSIGIATRQADRNTLDSLLKSADQSLYQAKSSGRNQAICVNNFPIEKQPSAGIASDSAPSHEERR